MPLDGIVDGLLAGTLQTPRPSVGRLADGSHWLYAGRTNCVAGESGSGKTWTALAAVASELAAGHSSVYIDLEDNEVSIVGRLLQMGVDPDALRDPTRFAYIHPDELIAHGRAHVVFTLQLLQPTLVVIDSTGESMAAEGCDPNSDDAVARWFQSLPTWIARQGPAVLLLDHLPKASAGAPSRSARSGSAQPLSGVQMIQTVKTGMAFARACLARLC